MTVKCRRSQAWAAALIVLRYLPKRLAHTSMHGAAESVEDALELGIAGVEPVFADQRFADDDRFPVEETTPTL